MYSSTRHINFFDCDPAGIMFFGNIYQLTHSVFEQFMLEKLPDFNYFKHPKLLFPLVHSSADYMAPIYPSAKVTITLGVKTVKKSSFTMTYSVYDDEGTLCAIVNTAHVTVSKENWQKSEIPAELKELLSKNLIS